MLRKPIRIIVIVAASLLSFLNSRAQSISEQMKVGYTQTSSFPIRFPVSNHIGGYLGLRYDMNLQHRLLRIDEEGILDGFVHRPGKQRWIGEHVGKYLEAAANTWEITKDASLKTQMDRIFQRLVQTQLPDGYLGTYLPDSYWTSWDVWVHKYDLYGLLAYYRVTQKPEALAAAIKIGNLICATFGENAGQRNILKSGSHVGMAATSILDPMLDLYMWTGDTKYLNFGKYILKSYNFEGGPAIVSALLKEKRVDKVANAKAYEMLSNILGLVKMYRLTNDRDLLAVINYTFNDIVANRLFVTGTSSDHEHFKEDDYLLADTSAHMGEGCVTTTWVQFNMQMFSLTGQLKYYNEIEKSIYNHLLGAENPETGCVSYYTPLIGVKPYGCNITCCLSSVPRGISFIPYLNYGKLNNIPTILMYENATIEDNIDADNGKKITARLDFQSTFPKLGKAKLKLTVSTVSTFTLQFRSPIWAENFRINVHGKTYSAAADELLKIKRVWKTGDIIDISFDMPVRKLDGGVTYPGYYAFKRGPQVLAVDYALNKDVVFAGEKFAAPNQKAYQLIDNSSKLPQGWIGSQLYTVKLKNSEGKYVLLNMVPYADGSQSGGFTDLWIKGLTMQ